MTTETGIPNGCLPFNLEKAKAGHPCRTRIGKLALYVGEMTKTEDGCPIVWDMSTGFPATSTEEGFYLRYGGPYDADVFLTASWGYWKRKERTNNNMKTLTCEDIVNETAAFYSQDPKARRSVGKENECLYQNAEGCRCSVGRCMTQNGIKKVLYEDGNDGDAGSLLKPLDYYLLKRYQGKSLEFWDNLQNLHDCRDNWTAKGLTKVGKVVVEVLLCRTRKMEWDENKT